MSACSLARDFKAGVRDSTPTPPLDPQGPGLAALHLKAGAQRKMALASECPVSRGLVRRMVGIEMKSRYFGQGRAWLCEELLWKSVGVSRAGGGGLQAWRKETQ